MNVDKVLFDNLKLLGNIIERPEKNNLDFADIEELILVQLPAIAKKLAPPDFYSMFNDFKLEFEKFRDFILYKELIGKNVVGVGGGFSSGKSSFLNALNAEKALPEDIDPSTSVPTYVINAEKYKVSVINIFRAKVEILPKEIKKIAHGFGEIDRDGISIMPATSLSHIVKSVLLESPRQRYKNLAFLDTPGYSKPEIYGSCAQTDEDIARGNLNSSNFILWFVPAETGTITLADVKFINSLRKDIPKVIVVSKADKKSATDLKNICDNVRKVITSKGIEVLDVLTYSREDNTGYDSNRLRGHLESWNDEEYKSTFAENFKTLFIRCHEFYESEIEKQRYRLRCLNMSLTQIEDDNEELLKPLELMVDDIRKNVVLLRSINEELRLLQLNFFTFIKLIGDQVNIEMPLPSEINLIGYTQTQDLIGWIEGYQKIMGIPTNADIMKVLKGTITSTKHFKKTQYQEVIQKLTDLRYGKTKPIKQYPVMGHKLQKASEAIKNMYFKVLCLMIRSNGDILEEQKFLASQIMRQVHAEYTFEEYMRQSTKVSREEYNVFMKDIVRGHYQHIFMVDLLTMIILIEDSAIKKSFIARVVEALKITQAELSFLLKVVETIIEPGLLQYLQSSDMCTIGPNTLKRNFKDNKKLHIVRNKDTLCLVSLYQKKIHLVNYFDLYGNTYYIRDKQLLRVVGAKISMAKGLDISKIESVQFINCQFIGKNKPIKIHECTEVNIIDCHFKGFKVEALKFDNIQKLSNSRNIFEGNEGRTQLYVKESQNV
ncbi:dynamin family protein [Candidatus Epulonipiscium viviparus]|uniref:dynamin family protein n=1 Tax=Candidatus Epulonipiscium viviparus TaxID=420336 RepID=UPI00016BFCD0|nr:dynamin family protein [Candidatus Epulopiscium viviparus]